MFLDKMTIAEAAKYLEFCSSRRSSIEINITQNILKLGKVLTDMNLRLVKRLWNLNAKIDLERDQVHIESTNSDKSWVECLDQTEDVLSGLFRFSVEEFESTKNFFLWLARSKHEYCTPSDLLAYLGRPKSDKKNVVKTVLEKLPLICLRYKEVTVLVDAEEFFGSAMKIVTLMELIEENEAKVAVQNKADEQPNIGKSLDEGKVVGPRKPGSGRPSLSKRRPDIVESIKEFASNCGITAHERRRNTVGQMGFNITDVKKFVQ